MPVRIWLIVRFCVGVQVATAVAEEAFAEGVAGIAKPGDIEAYLADRMWVPSNPLDVPIHFTKLTRK